MNSHINIYQKIKQLLFVTDYYSEQQQSGQYMVSRTQKKDKKITLHQIENSLLYDKPAIGAYSTSRADTCKWIVLDFDAKPETYSSLKPSILDVYKMCLNYGAIPFLEFSGNKGYHIWIFCEEMPSVDVFKAGRVLGGDIRGEIFPRQPSLDEPKESSYGNLVKLPCCINKKSEKRSQWLNIDFSPIKNQIAYFDKLTTTPTNVICQIASKFTGNLDVRREIKVNLNKTIDINASIFDITQERRRHEAHFVLIMSCLEAGIPSEEILDIGANWFILKQQEGKTMQTFDIAIRDFTNTLKYCLKKTVIKSKEDATSLKILDKKEDATSLKIVDKKV